MTVKGQLSLRERDNRRGNEKYFIADLPCSRCPTVDRHYLVVADTSLRIIVGRQSSTVHTRGRAPIKHGVACQHGRRILAQRLHVQRFSGGRDSILTTKPLALYPRPPQTCQGGGVQAIADRRYVRCQHGRAFPRHSPPLPSYGEGTLKDR